MALESLAQKIVDFANWGIAILVLMFIWELVGLIGSLGGKDAPARSGVRWFQKHLPWTEEAKGLRSTAVEKTTLLSQYIEDKKELGLLEAVQDKVDDLTNVLNAVGAAGKFKNKTERNDLSKKQVKDLSDAFSDARNEIRKLKRATFRANRGLVRFEKELYKEKGGKQPPKTVTAEENGVIAEHDTAIKAMTDAAKALATINNGAAKLNISGNNVLDLSGKFPDATSAKTIQDYIDDMNAAIRALENHLAVATKAQEKAYQLSQGLVAAMRKAW